MSVEFEEITGPAFLASVLVNGDESGLTTEEDQKTLEGFMKYIEGYQIIDVKRDDEGEAEEPYFSWSCRLYGADFSGGDLITYIAQKIQS